MESSEGIVCNFEDETGEHVQCTMHGLESRIFQHEYDHMEGTNFTRRVSKLKTRHGKERVYKNEKTIRNRGLLYKCHTFHKYSKKRSTD